MSHQGFQKEGLRGPEAVQSAFHILVCSRLAEFVKTNIPGCFVSHAHLVVGSFSPGMLGHSPSSLLIAAFSVLDLLFFYIF